MMTWFIWILIGHERLTIFGTFPIKYTGYLAALITTEQEPASEQSGCISHTKAAGAASEATKEGQTQQCLCILDIQGTLLPPMSHTHLHILASATQYITGELLLIFYWKRQNQACAGICWTSKHVNPWNEWDLSLHPWFLTLQTCSPWGIRIAWTEVGRADNAVSFPLLKLRAGENSARGWLARALHSANWLLRLKWHLCLIQVISYIYIYMCG